MMGPGHVFISGTTDNGAAFPLDDCQPWKLWSRENKRKGVEIGSIPSTRYYLKMLFCLLTIFSRIFFSEVREPPEQVFGGLEIGKGEVLNIIHELYIGGMIQRFST